jgi:HAD superfamily hydrolase (TIGR01509 family)
MKFKAAIFDFNGTLFWDTSFHDRAFDIMLSKHGVQLTDEEKRVKIHGKTNPIIMRGIFGEQLTDIEVESLAQEKEAIYRELCKNDLELAPGAEEFFDFLKNNGIPMTIATSAGIENVEFYFKNINLEKWFDFEKVVYDNGTFRGKPHPDVFLIAAEKLGFKALETIIFEDSAAGIISAEAANAGKIYIVNSYGADYKSFSHDIISNFNQVDKRLFELKPTQ